MARPEKLHQKLNSSPFYFSVMAKAFEEKIIAVF
jgi:hypothetical protein